MIKSKKSRIPGICMACGIICLPLLIAFFVTVFFLLKDVRPDREATYLLIGGIIVGGYAIISSLWIFTEEKCRICQVGGKND